MLSALSAGDIAPLQCGKGDKTMNIKGGVVTSQTVKTSDNSEPPPKDSIPDSGQQKPVLLWHLKNREGYNPQLLWRPYDVDFLWDRVIVVEGFWPYSRINVLDMNGRSHNIIAQGEILPYGVTVDSEGYIAVTDHKDRTVKFFTTDGSVQFSWQPNMFDWPDGIVATNTSHYIVTDWTMGKVSTHDIDGTVIRQFSSVDRASSTHSCPAYVTIDTHNRIITTDTFDHSVKIFDQAGKLLNKFGASVIKDPRGITIDSNNNILIADWGSNSVCQYSSDGRLISHLLTPSQGIKYPWGLAMNKQGKLLMSEQKLDENPGLKLFQCS